MTKAQLIKALQEAPFGDNAIVRIGHNCSNQGITISPDEQMDIQNIAVHDENELTIQFEWSEYNIL